MIQTMSFPNERLLDNYLLANQGKWFGLTERTGFHWSVGRFDGVSMATNEEAVAVELGLLEYPVLVEWLDDEVFSDEN